MTWNEFWGICSHKWVIIGTNEVVNRARVKIGYEYHLKCEKCGDIKVRKV